MPGVTDSDVCHLRVAVIERDGTRPLHLALNVTPMHRAEYFGKYDGADRLLCATWPGHLLEIMRILSTSQLCFWFSPAAHKKSVPLPRQVDVSVAHLLHQPHESEGGESDGGRSPGA